MCDSMISCRPVERVGDVALFDWKEDITKVQNGDQRSRCHCSKMRLRTIVLGLSPIVIRNLGICRGHLETKISIGIFIAWLRWRMDVGVATGSLYSVMSEISQGHSSFRDLLLLE